MIRSPLLHIYGSLSIQWYGVLICLGLLLFCWRIRKEIAHNTIISDDQFFSLLQLGILSALFGGRVLYSVYHWHQFHSITDFFSVWQGGFSILGSIIAVVIAITSYLYYYKLPFGATIDLIALYAPLLQGMGRIGCFLAGCCYGKATTMPWGIVCDQHSFAEPLSLHPTQLYSAFLLFLIFFVLKKMRPQLSKPGHLGMMYVLLAASERFIVDIYRGDQEYCDNSLFSLLSLNQWLALTMFIVTSLMFLIIRYWPQQKHDLI